MHSSRRGKLVRGKLVRGSAAGEQAIDASRRATRMH